MQKGTDMVDTVEEFKAADIPIGVFFEMQDLEEFHKKVEAQNWYPNQVKSLFATPRFVATPYDPHGGWPRSLTFETNANIAIPAGWTFKLKRLGAPPFTMQFGTRAHSVASTGADPEIFVVDGANRLLPAFRFLPEKEKAPMHPFYCSNAHASTMAGKAYWDGFQAEFSTYPRSCHGYFMDGVRAGLKRVLAEARKVNPKAKFTLKNVFRLTPDMLMSAAPEQVALGCDPSFNAYGAEPFVAGDPRSLPYRVAGGHIHLAISKLTEKMRENIIKGIDLLVGIPSVGMFAEIDNPIRRRFYGRAGEYRSPAYGLEYRVLSNAWLGDPSVAHLIFQLVRKSAAIRDLEVPYADMGTSPEQVQEIINNCDVKAARELVEKNKNVYEIFARSSGFGYEECIQGFIDITLGGVESRFKDYRDVEQNWMLNTTWRGHSEASTKTWRYAMAKIT